MSWDATDAMEDIITSCIKDSLWGCKRTVVRYLEKQYHNPNLSMGHKNEIKSKLDALRDNGE